MHGKKNHNYINILISVTHMERFIAFFAPEHENVTNRGQWAIGPENGRYGCNRVPPALKQKASALPAHKVP